MAKLEDILIEDLDSSDESTIRAAIFQLGKSPDLRAIQPLKRISAEGSPELKYLSRKLLALFEAQNPQAREQIRPPSLGTTGQLASDSPEAIAVRLSSEDPPVRGSALRSCLQARNPRLLPAILTRAYPHGEPHPPVA